MLIIFDLDDTLIETSLSLTSVLLSRFQKKLLEAGVEESAETLEKRFWKYYYECSSSSVAARLLIGSLSNFEKKDLGEALGLFQKPSLDGVEIEPTIDALKVLSGLKEKHHLALCTRGDPHLQGQKMKMSGVEPNFFDKICIGLEDKGIYYREILKHFGLNEFKGGQEQQSVVVCGDKVLFDLVPAKQLGCLTVQFLRPFRNVEDQLTSFVDHQIKSLNEIVPIVEKNAKA